MGKMKNMVILKDVKSNLVEEAIIVFKENVKIHEENFIKKNYTDSNPKAFKNDLCVKEAENIISNYISEVENESKEEITNRKIKFLKMINIALVAIVIVLAIV